MTLPWLHRCFPGGRGGCRWSGYARTAWAAPRCLRPPRGFIAYLKYFEEIVMTATQTDRLTEDVPTEERIRQRAHEIYLQRGDGVGSELDDWLEAEREIML